MAGITELHFLDGFRPMSPIPVALLPGFGYSPENPAGMDALAIITTVTHGSSLLLGWVKHNRLSIYTFLSEGRQLQTNNFFVYYPHIISLKFHLTALSRVFIMLSAKPLFPNFLKTFQDCPPMARTLKTYVRTKLAGRPVKYPWKMWLNGQIWEISKGDITSSLVSFVDLARKTARKMGLKRSVYIDKIKGKNVVVICPSIHGNKNSKK
jgi:hypothetical protein